MPHSPLRGCSSPGCRARAVSGSSYCEEHKKLHEKNYERYTRGYDPNKRYGRAWKRIRDRYVAEHPLCEMCLMDGRYTPVQEVHHIVPLSRGGTHDSSNLMSLCRSCHNKVHVTLKK